MILATARHVLAELPRRNNPTFIAQLGTARAAVRVSVVESGVNRNYCSFGTPAPRSVRHPLYCLFGALNVWPVGELDPRIDGRRIGPSL
jgi:hypothetical protein